MTASLILGGKIPVFVSGVWWNVMASHPRQSKALKTQHPPLIMHQHFISVSCL